MTKKILLYLPIVFLGTGLFLILSAHPSNKTHLALGNKVSEAIPSNLSASSINSLKTSRISTREMPTPVKINEIDPEYAADFSNDKILVGASHNIFIGKVIQQVGNKERGIGPETQFQVQVISNVKGNLSGDVVVDQQGGYENGTLYVVGDGYGSGDVVLPGSPASTYMLQPGSTYVLATRYSTQESWYTLNPYPTASKLLSSDSMLTTSALSALASNDARVQQLQTAYPSEVLLPADIAHNNTLNSYQQLFGNTLNQDSLSTSTIGTNSIDTIATTSPEATSSSTEETGNDSAQATTTSE